MTAKQDVILHVTYVGLVTNMYDPVGTAPTAAAFALASQIVGASIALHTPVVEPSAWTTVCT